MLSPIIKKKSKRYRGKMQTHMDAYHLSLNINISGLRVAKRMFYRFWNSASLWFFPHGQCRIEVLGAKLRLCQEMRLLKMVGSCMRFRMRISLALMSRRMFIFPLPSTVKRGHWLVQSDLRVVCHCFLAVECQHLFGLITMVEFYSCASPPSVSASLGSSLPLFWFSLRGCHLLAHYCRFQNAFLRCVNRDTPCHWEMETGC